MASRHVGRWWGRSAGIRWAVALLLLVSTPALSQATPLSAFDAMLQRTSVRVFDDRPVADGDLMRVVNAGWNARTVDGSRPFEFMVIRDPETLQRLAGATSFAKWMPRAKAAIAVVTRRDESAYHIENGVQAVASMQYAAQQLGLGSCFVGTARRSEMKRILGMTGNRWRGRHLLTVLPVGYPKAGKTFRSPKRVPLAETLYDGKVGQAPPALAQGTAPAASTKVTMASLLSGEQQQVTAFSRRQVGDRELRTALEMMRLSPSSKNRQPWRVVLVRDRATKDQLSRATGDPLLSRAPVVAVLASSLRAPPVRFGTQEQHDPHNKVKAGTRLTRHFIKRHDPSFALANLRLGLEAQGLGARVVMLNPAAEDVARRVLSPGKRPIGKRNLHMVAAVGIGHGKRGAVKQVAVPPMPSKRLHWFRR